MIRTLLLAGSAMFGGALQPAAAEGHRGWTLDDQLTVPDVRTLAIAADGDAAVYVVRVADRESDKTVAILRHVDLASGATRELLRAAWIEDLQRIPGTADWSARIDKGEGVQLYRKIGRAHV